MVDRELVSRSHAVIEFRQGKFILADRSTNGTYLLLDNGSRFFVRREEFTLHDSGIICLGQAVTENNPDRHSLPVRAWLINGWSPTSMLQ
jgi:adenylate cyclase